jgi:cellulase/cellobiase CelA1
MRLDTEIGRWYAVADDPGLSWEEKLAAYQGLVDDYYEADRFAEFCDQHLAHAEDCMAEYISSDQFDAHLVTTIQRAFPRTSTSSPSPTTAGCSAPGPTTRMRPLDSSVRTN